MELKLDFKDTKVELPKESGYYICLTHKGFSSIENVPLVQLLPYSKKYNAFNCADYSCEQFANDHKVEVLYWARIPKGKDCPWMYEEGQYET